MRLVQVRYKITEYMEDGGRIKEELFTVDADSDGEAEQKVYDYFNNISDHMERAILFTIAMRLSI
jgi:hypothetical protein